MSNDNLKLSSYVIGADSLLISCTEVLLNKGFDVKGIITDEPKIEKWAKSKSLPVFNFNKNVSDELIEVDYIFSITNLKIVPDKLLDKAKKGAFNFHDGPLPSYAGLNATTWAIINGEKQHGVTFHIMEKGIDTGNIVKQRLFDIREDETAFSLNAKCFEEGLKAFEELIQDLMNDNLQSKEQDLTLRTYFEKIKKPLPGSLINWNNRAEYLESIFRGLNFNNYTNPIGTLKFQIEYDFYIIEDALVVDIPSESTPGTITKIDMDYIQVATLSKEFRITKIKSLAGEEVLIKDFLLKHHIIPGVKLLVDNYSNYENVLLAADKKEDYLIKELKKIEYIDLPYVNKAIDNTPERYFTQAVTFFESNKNFLENIKELFVLFLSKLSSKQNYQINYSNKSIVTELAGFENLLSTSLPFNVSIKPDLSIETNIESLKTNFSKLKEAKTFYNDVEVRYPGIKNVLKAVYNNPLSIYEVDNIKSHKDEENSVLSFIVTEDNACYWHFNSAKISEESIKTIQKLFNNFLENVQKDISVPFNRTPIVDDKEYDTIINTFNNTKVDYDNTVTIHKQFEAQAELSSLNSAVAYKEQEVSYAKLNEDANRIANYLIAQGMKVGDKAGIHITRSNDLLTVILAVLKAGGVYVPLDPEFPKDRIHFMVEDSLMEIIITENEIRDQLPPTSSKVYTLQELKKSSSELRNTNPEVKVSSDELAYMIYTSGSTGKPKGVMISHRNVINFFEGMDKLIPDTASKTWVAVTSLSFDISVLELLYTLTRGYKVVVYNEADWIHEESTPVISNKDLAFSLFYFSSNENESGEDKYKLLMDGARFADENGFEAVWTPERHFHAFGGLYPNSSVTSAAIAAITKNVQIRAGSVVSPLHSEIRIAEEWSVVDNLSNGRAAISFAAGWMPNDFAILPGNFNDRKNIMFEQIEKVQKLWKGEEVTFTNPLNQEIKVKTLPRPVRKELPVWVTAAGNPETFEMAGAKGYNLLTHLLGQSIEELTEKIQIYRKALRENGFDENSGKLTLMMHTFVGENNAAVKEIVRQPMKEYLKSSVDLVKKAAWSFPAFKHSTTDDSGKFTLDNLTAEEMDVILDHSFERYYESSGLFGTPQTCLNMINKLKNAGVDEVACLIDFGIDSETVFNNLNNLKSLMALSKNQEGFTGYSVPSLIKKHNATHMQCTPSMAKMLVSDEVSFDALKTLKALFIGGEAFPENLAKTLSSKFNGSIFNMYGPTETTIWSSVYKLEPADSEITIGTPIANTQFYILDKDKLPVPMNVAGELYIGGDGVSKGYFNREELTAERFVENPFIKNEKIYRTGDLAKFREDGSVIYLGRVDFQVKVRGYRIELGEIENAINNIEGVRESVVMAREDEPGIQIIAAYVIKKDSYTLTSTEIKSTIGKALPDYMIPNVIQFINEFPLTPNGKIDRKSFPVPIDKSEENKVVELPENELEEKLVQLWKENLKLEKLGTNENFFDIGGHSLLAVQLHNSINNALGTTISLIDIFRFPTIKLLVNHISSINNVETHEEVTNSASRRRDLLKARAQRTKRNQSNDNVQEDEDE